MVNVALAFAELLTVTTERVPTESQQIVDRPFACVPDAERELIRSGNAARICGL